MVSVAENLEQIRKSLGANAPTILGVTKRQPIERVREAIAAGVRVLGNNYVQEGKPLLAEFPQVDWHFIGHIQSRKAKELGEYRLVESVDRFVIAEALARKAESRGAVQDILIEVNIGEEPQKSGVGPKDLESLLEKIAPLKNVRIRGLMGMPPPLDPVERRAPYFKALRKLFERPNWDVLSMGTSEDYLVAAREGSTLIRLGTVLFGARV